ncbi:MAG TPA: 16S rRNA (uracil(1498)-N(3))-methyltransferase [Verrucomicrobiales bacterium]|nr:16S rRNA (uracil(1498)-N(3))-methyltransferase [Verrucomicrobiales bacterium]
MSRFYVPPDEWRPANMVLEGAEAYHCLEVLRRREGDKIVVFNGKGQEATARIRSADRYRVELDVQGILRSPPLAARLVLAQAVIKGKRMDFVLEKATELGAAEVIPLLSDRSVVRFDAAEARRRQAKWNRVAVEACKQSGQNWAPVVREPVAVSSFLGEELPAELCLVASLQEGARPLPAILDDYQDVHGRRPGSALVLIGPEGDFTPAEMSRALQAGCQPLTLGPIVLRTETAALYGLSVLGYELLRGPVSR